MKIRRVGTIIAAASLSWHATAAAMSVDARPACLPTQVLPAASALPANAPGFVIQSHDGTPLSVALRNASGAAIPITLATTGATTIVTPAVELAPGIFILSYVESCTQAIRAASVQVGPQAPLPTAVGNLTAALKAIPNCHGENAQLEVTLQLDPHLQPFQEVTRVDVVFGTQERVGWLADPALAAGSPTYTFPLTCQVGSFVSGELIGKAAIAGQSPEQRPTPSVLPVHLPCPAAAPPCPFPARLDAGLMAPSPHGGVDAASSPGGSSGCTLGQRRRGGHAGWLLLLAVVAAFKAHRASIALPGRGSRSPSPQDAPSPRASSGR